MTSPIKPKRKPQAQRKTKPYDPDPMAGQRRAMRPNSTPPDISVDETIAKQIRRGKRAQGQLMERQFDEPADYNDGEDELPSLETAKKNLRKVVARRKKK